MHLGPTSKLGYLSFNNVYLEDVACSTAKYLSGGFEFLRVLFNLEYLICSSYLLQIQTNSRNLKVGI